MLIFGCVERERRLIWFIHWRSPRADGRPNATHNIKPSVSWRNTIGHGRDVGPIVTGGPACCFTFLFQKLFSLCHCESLHVVLYYRVFKSIKSIHGGRVPYVSKAAGRRLFNFTVLLLFWTGLIWMNMTKVLRKYSRRPSTSIRLLSNTRQSGDMAQCSR